MKSRKDQIIDNTVNWEKCNTIIERQKPELHFEMHFSNRVKFVKPDGTDFGESKIHKIELPEPNSSFYSEKTQLYILAKMEAEKDK